MKKAVLFSNYEPTLIDQKIRPKLVEHGVEILRQIHVDKTNVSIDVSKVDLVLFMPGLMSKGQKDKVKNIARYGHKRLIELQLHGNKWEKVLSHITPEQSLVRVEAPPPSYLRAVPPPPPSEEEVSFELSTVEPAEPEAVEPSDEEKLLEEYGEENTRLELELKELEARLARVTDSNASYSAEIKKLKADAAEAARVAQQQIEVAKKEVDGVHELRDGLEKSQQALTAQKELNKNQEAELSRLRAQRVQPPPSSSARKTQDFVAVRDAFKTLWRSGAMKGDAILQMLMEWEPKE